MDAHVDLAHISTKNSVYKTKSIKVTNGAIFKALDLTVDGIANAENVFYMHMNGLNSKMLHRNYRPSS